MGLREYTLVKGPLSTFDYLYDPKSLHRIADYPVVGLAPQAMPDAKFAEYRREASAEAEFLSSLLAALPPGPKRIAGMTDVGSGRVESLAQSLQGAAQRSSVLSYGASEDQVVLLEAEGALPLFWRAYPPSHGIVFFYLASTLFDVVEVFWYRKAADHRRRSDMLKRDTLEFAPFSKATLLVDEEGSFHIVALPTFMGAPALEEAVLAAGRKAGLDINAAPGLIG